MNCRFRADLPPAGRPQSTGIRRLVIITTIALTIALVCAGMTRKNSLPPALAASPIAIPPLVCAPGAVGPTPAAASTSGTPGVPVTAEGEVPVQIAAAVTNLIACWQAASWETSVALVTDRYLETTLGTRDRSAAVAALQTLSQAGLAPSVSLDSIADVRSQGSGFATADVIWREGKALRRDRWRFVLSQGHWLLNQTDYLAQDDSHSAVGIEAIVELDRLRLSRPQVVNPGIVVIHGRNSGSTTTSLSVFRAMTTDQLRDRLAGVLPPTGESPFVGEVIVPAGEEADLVLSDLASDTYTVVAGLHGPGGTLQIQDAFSASLAVAGP